LTTTVLIVTGEVGRLIIGPFNEGGVVSNSIKFNDREVTNSVLRGLIILAVVGVVLGVVFLIVAFVVALPFIIMIGIGLLISVMILVAPFHFILRAVGRKGLYTRHGNNYKLTIDKSCFDRQ
jgi:hypothetical protein